MTSAYSSTSSLQVSDNGQTFPKGRNLASRSGRIPSPGAKRSRMLGAVDGEYVKLTDAAARLGLSVHTLRRRIKRGELDAVQMPTRTGSGWYIWFDGPQPEAVSEPEEPSIDQKRSQATWRRELGELVLLVSRLQSENRDLAMRVGYLESELEHERSRSRVLEEDLRSAYARTPSGAEFSARR